MTWNIFTDGSCQHGQAQVPKRTPGWGGWCAVVEHGSDGTVFSGRVPNTTNVRMELKAATEGLKAVISLDQVVLYTDCTTLLMVRDKWEAGIVKTYTGADARYWVAFAHQLDRLNVRIHLLTRGHRNTIHRRAHTIAGAQARAGLGNMPSNAIPLNTVDTHRIRKGMRRVYARKAIEANLNAGSIPWGKG